MFFKNYYTPGKGVDKNAPKLSGAKLYFDVLFREFFSLLGLSLLYCLCCVPVVTAGAATLSYTDICSKLVKGENVYVFHDFFQGIKKFFKKGLIFTLLIIIIVADYFILGFTILSSKTNSFETILAAAVCFFLLFFITAFFISLLHLSVLADKTVLDIVKSAVILMLTGGKNILFAVLFDIIFFALVWLYFPLSGFVAISVGFVLLFVTNSFFISPLVDKMLL